MRRAWVIGGLVVVAVLAAGVVWTGRRGHHRATPAGEVVAVQRGDVAITVGGIGHVTTLTGAVRGQINVGTASGKSTASTSTSTASSSSSGSGPSSAPPDAVFPAVAGHVERVLVHPGEQVVAGQPVAIVADDGTLRTAVLQARSDLGTARLELAQKRVQDPTRGPPPTPAEIQSGRAAIAAARARLGRLQAPALAADVAAARADVAKAQADLLTARAGGPQAVAAAQLAVLTASQRLQVLTGAPDPAELAAAQLELAKATVDQEALLRPSPGAAPSAVRAADLAIELAQVRLTEALSTGTAVDVAAARADLAKAQSERDALTAPAPAPSPAAQTAASLAVDVAQRRLDGVLHPSAATISAARAELAKSEADLATAQTTQGPSPLAALRAARTAARRKLQRLLGPPTHDVVATARADVRKARADLSVLGQRGAPAAATDLALARLKVDVGAQRLALTQQLAGRLTVRSPSTGTVTSILSARGAAVDGATPIARVQDLEHIVVNLDLSEFDVSRTHVGAPALVTADALGGREFGGRVTDVALTGSETGGVVNFPVIIAMRSRGALRPGMSVSARIIIRRVRHVVRVPLNAVIDRAGRPTVQVRLSSGATAQRRVHLGLSGATVVQVRSGLRAGERIVVPTGGG